MNVLKWLINVAILIYMLILCALFLGNGSGFKLDLGLFSIKAHSPAKPLIIFAMLSFLRLLLSLEIKNAILLIVSLIFSLFMSEAALRLIDARLAREPELQQWRQPSPTLGWELIPDLEGKGHMGSNIRINSHGLRDVEHSWDKPQDTYRILGLGDSFTFGYGINLEHSYLKQLESLFKDNGKSVEVINAGVIGYNFYQSLTYLKQKGINYHPDLIIFFYYIDDLTGISSKDEAMRVSNELVQDREKPHSILSTSYLYNFVTNSISLIDVKFRSRTGADWIKSIEDREAYLRDRMATYKIDESQLKLLRGLLAELKQLSNQIGADLLIVAIPDAAQIGIPEMQTPYILLQRECENIRVPFLDIISIFEKQPDLKSLYLFPMDAHTNPRGNSIIAEKLYDFVVDQMPLD